MLINIPVDLNNLAKMLKKEADIFLVGGYVRNAMLGINAGDIDIASCLTTEKLQELLKGSKYTVKEKSKKLGTCVITSPSKDTYEHSTFREESYPDNGQHKPTEVKFVTEISSDAKRRDFTINTIYYNVTKEETIDPYSGSYDIEKKRIRTIETPEEVFSKDGLRILRLIRIACELNLAVDKKTGLTAEKMAYRLKDISGTRKFEELMRILSSSEKYPKVSRKDAYLRGLELVNSYKIWPQFFVPISKVNYHMVKKVKPEDRFLGLLIDIIDSLNPDCIAYYLRYLLGPTGFNLQQKNSELIINIISGYYDALNKISNKEYFFKYFANFEFIGKILPLKSKIRFMKYNFFYEYIIKFKVPVQIKDLKINGDDLKKAFPKLEQKKYSVILKDLLNKVFEGEIANEKDALLKEVKENVKYY